jgi:hypothetical protein
MKTEAVVGMLLKSLLQEFRTYRGFQDITSRLSYATAAETLGKYWNSV